MTRDTWERIVDGDMLTVRTDGAIVWDSRLSTWLTPAELEKLLSVASDHIGDDVDGETIEWSGLADDMGPFE